MNDFLKKLGDSILIWCVAAFVFGFLRMYGVDDLLLYERATEFRWGRFAMQMMLLGLSIGIPFAMLDYILAKSNLKNRSYWIIIIVETGLQVLLGLISLYIVVYFSWAIHANEMPVEEQQRPWEFLLTRTALVWIGYTLMITNLIYFFRLLKDKIGSRVLLNLMLGKYHKPREEQRIFMFLDMKDSTTHAEKLGHLKFSALVQDCFRDLTDAILKHSVEVYQYVGDEAILTWTPREGFSQAHCVRVYFTFMRSLAKRRDYYVQEYNVFPFFKAGVHVGPVTVSEIGVVKREIAYLSDVLNTAARIQGMCNQYGAGLLVSENIQQNLDVQVEVLTTSIGQISLKGKKNMVGIYEVADMSR